MPSLRSSFAFALALVLASAPSCARVWAPRDLQIAVARIDSGGTRLVRLRTFLEPDGSRWMIALDPDRLRTSVRSCEGWTSDTTNSVDTTTWDRLRGKEYDYGWKHSGLTRDLSSPHGMVLSVDLCPSRHPLEKRLVAKVAEVFGTPGRPVPIAFAISGDWIRAHEADLAWLLALEAAGRIEPTWINHTDNHYYRKGYAENLNFLFLPGTDVRREILGAEAEMLRHGLVPSVFFRFPGLMDNEELFAQVMDAGLLPVGADAWLAKNQPPRHGSIVLVHGNGNEPQGVFDLLRFVDRRRLEIDRGQWKLVDLASEVRDQTNSVTTHPGAAAPSP